MLLPELIIYYFKIIMTVFYLFGLFFTSRKHVIFGPKEDDAVTSKSMVNFFYKMYNMHGEWAIFTGLDGSAIDLKIEATTKKAKYQWFLNKEKQIGDFKITRASSRALLSQLYTRVGRPFLNRFLKSHLVEYFKHNGDELIELKIESVVLDTLNAEDRTSAANRTRIRCRLNPYGFGYKTKYLWKK
ncbi:hypothetical protein EBU71_11100 [bacterium]|nr:hypothetical protein [Candidatus Elulimicrobium humile]